MNKEFWKRNNRQFKFRVWEDGRFLFHGTIGWTYEENIWIVKLGGEVVQQSTGCKDIDGKEIFEGDILKTDEAGWIGVVVFGGGGFGLKDKDGGFSSFPNWGGCKIIGNVLENPELVE